MPGPMPLDGVVVADFSRVLAGPLAASTLADLGADVIKVERAASGDVTRQWGPPWTGNSSSYFESANRGKRSLGNRHPSIAPYEALDTGEGVLALAVGNDAQFVRLCEIVGDPDLAGDPRFVTNAQRVAHRDELAVALEARLRSDTAASWATRLMDAGVPAGTIGTVADGFALAEHLGLDPRVPVPGGADQIRSPLRFERTPIGRYERPPRLDEHGDEIRRWLAADPDSIGQASDLPEGEDRGIHG
ncbi:CoA transferase [Microbacterium sp.]|uniref:CoA transferase n=1 Tax=Microbacterium sp. TaxID=51671 RepID=UPI00262F6F3F|nr:CoA transferase [Microbacterium sp.]